QVSSLGHQRMGLSPRSSPYRGIILIILINEFGKRQRNIAESHLRCPSATCFANRPGPCPLFGLVLTLHSLVLFKQHYNNTNLTAMSSGIMLSLNLTSATPPKEENTYDSGLIPAAVIQ
ncbi:MAG TPA: hypothetical protein VHV10_14255, partial [Ktedonobacteraceae bacterium]|nr:hypothetical protein [Ktedonobacteraceae bacterium]